MVILLEKWVKGTSSTVALSPSRALYCPIQIRVGQLENPPNDNFFRAPSFNNIHIVGNNKSILQYYRSCFPHPPKNLPLVLRVSYVLIISIATRGRDDFVL